MATVAAKKPSRAEAGHLLLEGKTAIHRFRAAGKVRATMRAGAMQCRAHAHDAVTKDFQKKHLPKASCSGSDAWVAELARPGLHLYLEGRDVLVSRKGCLEVFELLTLLVLDLDRDLAAAAEEAGDRLEVLLRAAARRHGRRAMRTPPGDNADASPGTVFLFRVIETQSQTFSTLEPVRPCGRRSHKTKWLSVPPVASLWPFSTKVAAKVAAFSTTHFEYSLNSGVATSRS